MNLIFARSQMALSLGFHIVFAAAGIALPLLMVMAEWKWRRTGDRDYERLTRAWARGTAVLFAVGAVSGTVLSFELGLLFPGFMSRAGAIIGMPFSLEGFAFFTEAIFLGVYLYGRERVGPRVHLFAGVMVALSGLLSAVFVTLANAWMNAPRGFRLDPAQNGAFVDISPLAAMTTPFGLHEVVHMALASYMAVGFASAAIHAGQLLRDRTSTFHRKALGVSLALAIPCTLLQPLVGHFAGHQVAHYQPIKLAAMEGQMETRAYAPVHLGPLAIPAGLSVLAYNSPSAVVHGLDEVPPADRPPSAVRWAFQIMVLLGGWLALLSAWVLWRLWRKRPLVDSRALLHALRWAAPLGFLAIEAGWVVTELGRQPWVIYGVVRTAETVTPMPGLWVPFTTFALVYLGLAAVVVTILRRQVRQTAAGYAP